MDFRIARQGGFNVEYCYDCLIPGCLIFSPVTPAVSLAALPRDTQAELGPLLATVTEVVQNVMGQLRVYCTLFGEELHTLHFHVFPRTAALTNDFLHDFPEQRSLIHGPVLFDRARSRYQAPKHEVWGAVFPIIPTLQERFKRRAEIHDRRHA